MPPRPDSAEAGFLEEISLSLRDSGFPRMAGRIVGRLLVCAPEHQSAAELARALHASKGSISTMTRLLEGVGLVERIGVPGRREACFQLQRGAWPGLLTRQLARVTSVRRLAERGLTLLADRDPTELRRLRELRELYARIEAEVPELVTRCAASVTE